MMLLVSVVSIPGLPIGKLMVIRQNTYESVQIVIERDGEPEIVKQLKALICEMTNVDYLARPIADAVVEKLHRILQQDTVPQVQNGKIIEDMVCHELKFHHFVKLKSRNRV